MQKLTIRTRTGRGSSGASLLVLWLVGALVLLASSAGSPQLVAGQEQLTVESRQQKEPSASENELTEELKYLEKLDKYWSEVARPRFGRSEYKQAHGLPRFGAQRVGLEAPRSPFGVASRPTQDQNLRSLLELMNARAMAQRFNGGAY